MNTLLKAILKFYTTNQLVKSHEKNYKVIKIYERVKKDQNVQNNCFSYDAELLFFFLRY